ncbi:MAG: 50S ribosomal protein L11 methyltransferase [Opitutales bacterium]
MITARAEVSEAVADQVEALGCEAEPTSFPWSVIQPRPEDPWMLQGYFNTPEAARAGFALLRTQIDGLPATATYQELPDQAWQDAYKLHLKPWACGRLQWVPAWDPDPAELTQTDDTVRVILDSGMAFGTGSHETTRLCARRLVDWADSPAFDPKATVIDAGCGSGVLALSALALGVESVFAFDNDPEAVRIAAENADINGLASRCTCAVHGLDDGLTGRQADLLLANIQTPILNPHAETLLQALAPGGRLVLSGILTKEGEALRQRYEQTCQALYQENGYVDSRTDGEWCDLVFQRP